MADPVTWLAIGTMAAAGGQVYSGMEAKKAASKQASLQEYQGQLAREEAEREASKTEKDAKSFRSKQMVAYLKSGVTLEGSPLLVLEDTIKQGQEEADAIRKRGYATQTLYNEEAQITRQEGKAAYISGILGATGTTAKGMYTYNQNK